MTNHPKQKELNSFLWQAEHGWKYDPLPQDPADWSEPAPKEWESILGRDK